MMRTVKTFVCAATLAAITTINAHADLIVIGPVINEPTFFSATFQWTVGQGGVDVYNSPDGANWSIDITASTFDPGLIVNVLARHDAAPHGSPEVAPNPNTSFAASIGTLPGLPPSDNANIDHPAISGHQDLFATSMEQLGTSPVWRITVFGRHVEEVPGVPDAASSVMLLGLGVAGLGTVRRYLKL